MLLRKHCNRAIYVNTTQVDIIQNLIAECRPKQTDIEGDVFCKGCEIFELY